MVLLSQQFAATRANKVKVLADAKPSWTRWYAWEMRICTSKSQCQNGRIVSVTQSKVWGLACHPWGQKEVSGQPGL